MGARRVAGFNGKAGILPGAAFATLFFALYNEELGRIAYVNCGHPAPLLLRHSGAIEKLAPTATVIGLFPNWTCAVEECALDPGDTLVMFTDGVLEAFDEAGEEFGEDRLISAIQEHREKPPQAMSEAILKQLGEFGGPDQSDDITLLVARHRIG